MNFLSMFALICFVCNVLPQTKHRDKHMRGKRETSNIMTFMQKQHASKLIIDTDGGVDDAIALMIALANTDIQILAITTTVGNTLLNQVIINVLKTLRVINSKKPVYPGSQGSILITPPIDDYFGNCYDCFGDVPDPNPPSVTDAQKEHAVSTMIRLVRLYPKQITIVALGPPTNLALAIRVYPDFKKLAKMIYWFGGSIKGVGNVKPGLEFNAYFDSAATFILFNSTGPPVVMVPWETLSAQSRISSEWRRHVLGKLDSEQIKFLNAIERKTLAYEFWNAADAKTMALVLNPEIITKVNLYHVEVIWQGEARGLTIVDYCYVSGKEPNAIIIEDLDVEAFKSMALYYLGLRITH